MTFLNLKARSQLRIEDPQLLVSERALCRRYARAVESVGWSEEKDTTHPRQQSGRFRRELNGVAGTDASESRTNRPYRIWNT
jgi:hypothetical protein